MPTSARSTAHASCSFICNIGSMLAPFLVYLNQTWAPASYFCIAMLGALNGLVSYGCLVETKGISLDAIRIDDDESSTNSKKDDIEEQVKMIES